MDYKKMTVKLTFTEQLLGTCSANPELHSEFIASKAPDANLREEEIAALGADAVEKKEMTVFPRDEAGNPFLYDYQIKGFFKGVCGFLRRVPGTEASKIKAYKKVLDGLLFVAPRKVSINLSGKIGNCQRPLRAETLQGERIALANSETVPAGSTVTFDILMVDPKLEDFVREALDFGALSGIGQWRNSGAGRYLWDELESKGKIIGGNNAFAKKGA